MYMLHEDLVICWKVLLKLVGLYSIVSLLLARYCHPRASAWIVCKL